ncbi:MAG: hypothetical protein U9R54_04895, partial [Bacteroidota bacterium]|nr:hypothetical protein [Bacteroidota bacterium]
FFKNNEYFSNFSKGYTLLGFHVAPTLSYYPNENIKISGGVHLLKYSGRDNFKDAIPTFSFQYKVNNSINIIMGTLYSGTNHNLIAPMYNFDNFIENNVESGLQFLLDFPYLKTDIWLNWNKFILKDDPFQEELTTGFVTELNVLSEGDLSISIPVQSTAVHHGGQINDNNTDVKTIINTNYGIDISYTPEKKFLKAIKLNSYYLIYENLSPNPAEIYKDGYGIYNTLSVDFGYPLITIGYWKAKEYISAIGNPLFQSISDYKLHFSEPERELLTFNISYSKEIFDNINLGLRIETYYDIISTKMDYNYGLYFTFNRDFFIRKI